MEERDILVFDNEEGEEIQLEILDYFEYEGVEYAMLTEVNEDDSEDEDEHAHHHDHGCDSCSCHGGEKSIYLMKVVINGEEEEFLPVEEEKMDELIAVIDELYNDEDEDEDGYEDYEDDDDNDDDDNDDDDDDDEDDDDEDDEE